MFRTCPPVCVTTTYYYSTFTLCHHVSSHFLFHDLLFHILRILPYKTPLTHFHTFITMTSSRKSSLSCSPQADSTPSAQSSSIESLLASIAMPLGLVSDNSSNRNHRDRHIDILNTAAALLARTNAETIPFGTNPNNFSYHDSIGRKH